MPKCPPGTVRKDLYIPEALGKRLTRLLNSPALGRVPYGSWNSFFVQRANEFFNSTRLPLGQYEGFEPDAWVMGTPQAIARIAKMLEPLRKVDAIVDAAFPELNPLHTGENDGQAD